MEQKVKHNEQPEVYPGDLIALHLGPMWGASQRPFVYDHYGAARIPLRRLDFGEPLLVLSAQYHETNSSLEVLVIWLLLTRTGSCWYTSRTSSLDKIEFLARVPR